jgi:probable F420-dependent oxidoreductase
MTDVLRLDSELSYGTTLSDADPDATREMARRIEDAGFDAIWVGDHIAFHFPIADPLTLLAYLAGVTERVSLGTSVYLLPLRPPMVSAKSAATLDRLSGGRLQLGVGVGGEYPPEFEAVGVPVGQRGSRCDEAIGLLRRLWTEEKVEHRGRHYRLGPVTLEPKPLQAGGPPILIGGRKAPALRRAGRLGDGYISHMCSAETYRDNLDEIRRHAEAAGREEHRFRSAAFVFTILDDDWNRAHKRAAATLQTMYRRPFEEAARKYCLLGRPEDCREQMQPFIDAGCRQFIFSPLMNPNEFLTRAEAELLPLLTGF